MCAKDNRIRLTELINPFRSIWIFLLINIGIGFMLVILLAGGRIENLQSLVLSALGSGLISITQWLGHAWINAFIGRRISWLEEPLKKALWLVFCMVIYTIVAFLAVQLSLRAIIYGRVPNNLVTWMIESSLLPLILSFTISGFFAGRGFYVNWRNSELKAQKLKVEMLNYRYEALRNQINPHFLFNSFNVLSDLVYEDQDQAVEFIRQLSDLYRYVLDSREKELIPLNEEMDFIESYVFLLKTRFDDKIHIRIELQPQANEMIVPMTLQMLIENAVKHNEASKKHPLQISLLRENDKIVVQNGLKIRSVGDDSKKTGLKNISQQYAYLSDQDSDSYRIEIEKTESDFQVRVPIIKQTSA